MADNGWPKYWKPTKVNFRKLVRDGTICPRPDHTKDVVLRYCHNLYGQVEALRGYIIDHGLVALDAQQGVEADVAALVKKMRKDIGRDGVPDLSDVVQLMKRSELIAQKQRKKKG